MRLAEIQTSHRRVIILHCERITMKRTVDTARSLGLLDGQKIWILLDGVIGHEISSPLLLKQLNPPSGVLAISQRVQQISDINTLMAILKLVGTAVENSLKNSIRWTFTDLNMKNSNNGSSTSTPEASCWHNVSSTRRKLGVNLFR